MMKHVLFFFSLIISLVGLDVALAQARNATSTIAIGDMRVSVLVDSERAASEKVLRRASPELLKQYLPQGRFALPVHAVLVQKNDLTILIDAGFGNNLPLALARHNVTTEDVDILLLTHLHSGHFEGLLRRGAPVFTKARLFISENAQMYWESRSPLEGFPDTGSVQLAEPVRKCERLLAAYKERITLFTPRDLDAGASDLLPGIDPVAAYGHTPGHTVFRLHDQGKELFVLGDLVLAGAIQFAHPEVTTTFDMNQDLAARSRARFLAYVEQHNIPVTGMHFTTPYIGIIEKSGQAGEAYVFRQYKAE